MLYKLENEHVVMTVQEHDGDVLTIQGKVSRPTSFREMVLIAPNPIDRMMNYAGSGLPFPCPSIAFENTPNRLTIDKSGIFHATFKKPNSYYTEDTQEKIKPSIFVKLLGSSSNSPIVVRLELEESTPLQLRTLFYRKGRTGPEFYQKRADVLGIQGQEAILRQTEAVKISYDCA